MNASVADRTLCDQPEGRRLISLSADEIHLWVTFYDDTIDLALHAAYRQLLNEEEKRQEQRFYFARDRCRYLSTRALVRTTLSRYIAIHPKDWIFSTNAYGRPQIVNAQASDVCLSFNISHTDGLIVLGVTKERALGVDVENVFSRKAPVDIDSCYFAPQEAAVLAAAPAHEKQYRFFEYWTFKEAYIKARGQGLSLPLEKISFHYPDAHSVGFTLHPELADDSANWQFWQFRPKPEYLIAVCAERAGIQSARLTVRVATPMMKEDMFAIEFLRASKKG